MPWWLGIPLLLLATAGVVVTTLWMRAWWTARSVERSAQIDVHKDTQTTYETRREEVEAQSDEELLRGVQDEVRRRGK